MAQVVVDSRVMRDKAKTLENSAGMIQSLYAEMLQEVTATANRMKGTTIETEQKQFARFIEQSDKSKLTSKFNQGVCICLQKPILK